MRKRCVYFGSLIIILIIVVISAFYCNRELKNETILNRKDYQYFPSEADDYIELEPSFNLSAVDTDGDGIADASYTTPMKNQGNLGVCWSYVITEIAESYMMVTENKPYQEGKTKILSARQLDYLNLDLINGYKNPYGMANFSYGSDFNDMERLLSYGLSLADINWDKKNSVTIDSQDKLDYSAVFNNGNSLYELNSTIELPELKVSELDLLNQSDKELFDNYIKTIKKNIKKYGGAYIGTFSPGRSCSTPNIYDTSHYILGINSKCESNPNNRGHAMQLVGWDDNYKYKYCKGINNSSDIYSCNDEDIVDDHGVWILRNSWGEESDRKYVYLPYISDIYSMHFISNLTPTSEREWNYISNSGGVDYTNSNIGQYIIDFKSKFNLNAKLIKVKFKNKIQNGKFKIYISENGDNNNYSLIRELIVEYPGYTSIDFSLDNYKINNKSLIKIVPESAESMDNSKVHAFIKEINDNSYIITPNYNINESIEEGGYNKIYIYSDTYNIESNETIQYKIFNDKNEDITSQVIVKNNIVGSNGVNALLYLPKSYNGSYFIVKTYYRNFLKSTSKIVITGNGLQGLGTEDSPYIISTIEDFYTIGDFLDAHYILQNDIDLTNDSMNKLGWEPFGKRKEQRFTGVFDGKNHKIIGLNIANNGLFYGMGGVEGNSSCIKNIIFENVSVSRGALLAGYIKSSKNASIEISNIAVINSTFERSTSLISFRLYVYGGALKISNIFSDSTINNNFFSLVDAIESFDASNFIIDNIEILGRFNVIDNDDRYKSTPLLSMTEGNVKINNVIFNNYVNSKIYLYYGIDFYDEPEPELKNIYYLGEVDNPQPQYCTNVVSKTIDELKNKNNYANWNGFDDNWVIKEIDGINRIPILKFVPFEYTKISDIKLNINEEVSIYDYLTPKSSAAKNISYEILNNKIANIDSNGKIRGLSSGKTAVHVISYYDGYEKDVSIEVVDKRNDVITLVPKNVEYTGSTVEANKASSLSNTIMTYTYYDSNDCSGKTLSSAPINVGIYSVKAESSGNEQYSSGSICVTHVITKSNTTTNLGGIVKTYSGNVQGVSGASAKLNSNNSIIKDAKFTYKYYTNGTCKTGEIEAPTNAGTYYVQAILTETASYNSSISSCVKYTINKKKAALTIGSVPKLEVGKKVNISYTYDGDGTISCTSSDSNVVKCLLDTSNKKITLELLKEVEKNVTITVSATEGNNYSKADDKSITLTINGATKLSEIIKNNNYSINNNYVLGIAVGSSVSELKSKLGSDVTIESAKTIISTGTIIKKGNESYTIVIKGDINGDGKISSLDYVAVRKYIMRDEVINNDSIEFMAADMNDDNDIKAMDYIRIRKIIMGK